MGSTKASLAGPKCFKKGNFVDIGAGSGYFTKELLNFTKDSIIFALDIQQKMLDYISENMPDNIKPKLISDGIFPIENSSIDAVWSINVYHEIKDLSLFLSETKRILNPGGRLLIVDWDKNLDACEHGPKYETRIDSKQIIKELTEAGLIDSNCITKGLTNHYAITAANPS